MNVCTKLDLAKGKKNGLVVIKLDISKAYDRVVFLEASYGEVGLSG